MGDDKQQKYKKRVIQASSSDEDDGDDIPLVSTSPPRDHDAWRAFTTRVYITLSSTVFHSSVC